jgi:hypothetical protein
MDWADRLASASAASKIRAPMFKEIFGQMIKQLGQLDQWLTTAATYAADKKIDPTTVLNYRIAADQFPLVRQVQIACDTAKLGSARLTGKDAPNHPDTELTFDELHARVRAVRGFLEGHSDKDFADAATRVITRPNWEGKIMHGSDFLLEHVMPNFFFHVTHTYAILRHVGVPLGKKDYLGQLSLRDNK